MRGNAPTSGRSPGPLFRLLRRVVFVFVFFVVGSRLAGRRRRAGRAGLAGWFVRRFDGHVIVVRWRVNLGIERDTIRLRWSGEVDVSANPGWRKKHKLRDAGVEEGLACSNPAALTRIPSRLHVPWNCSTSDAMCGASISSATRDGALGRLITDGSPPDASSTANEEDVPDLADGDGVVTSTPSSSTASSSLSEDMRGQLTPAVDTPSAQRCSDDFDQHLLAPTVSLEASEKFRNDGIVGNRQPISRDRFSNTRVHKC
jgi:hypothetical protein